MNFGPQTKKLAYSAHIDLREVLVHCKLTQDISHYLFSPAAIAERGISIT